MSLIEAKAVCVYFGKSKVLENVSLSVKKGEIVTIVGPNGSGKSTLLRALLGVVPITSGGVSRQKGLRIGYIPQKLMLERSMPMTVRRFLSLPYRVSDHDAHDVLAQVGVGRLALRQMADLSGGQMQRVLLARALINKPHLLILDEPAQGLDQTGEAQLYHLIAGMRAQTGAAILMVSHDLHVVMAASDRVICLNGHVCCEGAPAVVSTTPEYRALFGSGTQGALALYRHDHDHDHHHNGARDGEHDHPHGGRLGGFFAVASGMGELESKKESGDKKEKTSLSPTPWHRSQN